MVETGAVMSVFSAGKLLGLSRPTAYKLAKQGVIPTLRLGRRIVVPRIALQRLLESAGQSAKS